MCIRDRAIGDSGCDRTTSAAVAPEASSAAAGSSGRWVGGGPAIRSLKVIRPLCPRGQAGRSGGERRTTAAQVLAGHDDAGGHPGLGCLAPCARVVLLLVCLLYTSPSPRDRTRSRMPSSA